MRGKHLIAQGTGTIENIPALEDKQTTDKGTTALNDREWVSLTPTNAKHRHTTRPKHPTVKGRVISYVVLKCKYNSGRCQGASTSRSSSLVTESSPVMLTDPDPVSQTRDYLDTKHQHFIPTEAPPISRSTIFSLSLKSGTHCFLVLCFCSPFAAALPTTRVD